MAINVNIKGFQSFEWKGKPIVDIHKWAKDHHQPMVSFHAERTSCDPMTRQKITEWYDGEMPESFFACLRLTDGWVFTKKEVQCPPKSATP